MNNAAWICTLEHIISALLGILFFYYLYNGEMI